MDSIVGFALLGALGLIVLLIVGAGILIVFLVRKGGGGHHRQTREQEARMMQDLHQGFSQLEERIESLETILLDRARERQESWK